MAEVPRIHDSSTPLPREYAIKKLSLLAAVGAATLAVALPGAAHADPLPAAPTGHKVLRLVELDAPAPPPAGAQAAPQLRAARAQADRARQDGLLAAARAHRVPVTEKRRLAGLLTAVTVEVDTAHVGALSGLPGVRAVHRLNTYAPPKPVTGTKPPADTKRANVTVTELTGVPKAHKKGATGQGTTIGIIDSGIDYTHPDLGGGGFPNDKVVGGYDVVDGDADPKEENYAPGFGHGTHVAGIAAGNGKTLVGVAPDAKIRSYRVFGDQRPTTDDVVIEALARAVADGVDVVNLSLGQAQDEVRQDALVPRALDLVAAAGVVPVVSIGNGYAGPFSAGTPGIAKRAIGVGSAFTTAATHLALGLSDGTRIPYNVVITGPVSPTAGRIEIVHAGAVCEPAAPGTYARKAVLVTSDWYPCTPTEVIHNVTLGGAVAALYYEDNEWTDPDSVPQGSFWGREGTIPAVTVSTNTAKSLRERGTVSATWGHYWSNPLLPEWAGLPDPGSSWGPSHELDFKPDVLAPGGYVFSSVPKVSGSYAVMSGTSMAAPHVAGSVAVLLAGRGPMTVEQVRDLLQATAVPAKLSGDPARGLHQVAQQGAGMIDLPAALAAPVTLSPGKLPLGELEGREVTRQITLTNTRTKAMVYDLGHEAGLGAAPPYTGDYGTVVADGQVTLDKSVSVPARGSLTVTVRLRAPANVPDGTVFGGWITFTPRHGGQTLRTAYLGIAGDWHKVSAVNPTFSKYNEGIDNPSLRPADFDFGRNEPVTLDGPEKQAWVMISHGFPTLRELRLEVLDATGAVVAVPLREEHVVRVSGVGTGMRFYSWDGTLADGSAAPNGEYRLRLVFDKYLGRPEDVERWTSPVVTVRR
ncbi:S8 family serine peptidase [Longispora urticae]